LEIKAASRHFAGVIAGQASLANVGPQGVDRACRRNADVSHEGSTTISAASHASVFVINIYAGDLIEIRFIFQRETRPFTRKRTACTTGSTRRGGKLDGLR
jgi:hypothetical protein